MFRVLPPDIMFGRRAGRRTQDAGDAQNTPQAQQYSLNCLTPGTRMSVSFLSAAADRAAALNSAAKQEPRDGAMVFDGVDVRQVWQVYEKKEILGTGAFGTVYRAQDRVTGTIVAVKQLQKDKAAEAGAEDEALHEFQACARLSHPHIMRAFSFFDAPQAVYLVSELAGGGELNDYLAQHKELNTERGIANVASQVLAALIFMHEANSVHHDIKPPNILVTSQKWSCDTSGVTPVVLLGDFGTCRLRHASRASMRAGPLVRKKSLASHALLGALTSSDGQLDVLGTPEYCGPEVFEGKSGYRTDVYALGVTLFELLSGEKPFEVVWGDMFDDSFDADASARYAQMSDIQLPANLARLKGVSPDGVACIGRMLDKRYDARPTAKQCSDEGWFRQAASPDAYFSETTRKSATETALSDEEAEQRARRMQRRASACFCGKALSNLVASRISDEVLRREKALFMRADGIGEVDGKLDAAELHALFAAEGWDAERAQRAVGALATDGSSGLGFNDWVAATIDLNTTTSKAVAAQVRALFDELDRDGSGQISANELRAHFGSLTAEQEVTVDAFCQSLDTDGDGTVSRAEFGSFWNRM